MAKPFLDAFHEMVSALRAHPKVQVHEVVVRPPAKASAIAAVEEALKRPLPGDLRDFYLAHDGVFLSWGLKGREVREPVKAFNFPDYGAPPGVVNLLPLLHVFSTSWVDESHVNWTSDVHKAVYGVKETEEEMEDDERIRAVIVDNYAKFHHADLVFGPRDQPAWMLIADDHGAELLESNLSSFRTYLDVTLALWGTNRMPAYKVKQYKKLLKIEGPKKRPSLDAIVAELEADEER